MTALDGMTQDRWAAMTVAERDKVRSPKNLTAQLVGLEGKRVEVKTHYGETRRFWVGKSTGWATSHLEILKRNSSGGCACESSYASVRVLGGVR